MMNTNSKNVPEDPLSPNVSETQEDKDTLWKDWVRKETKKIMKEFEDKIDWNELSKNLKPSDDSISDIHEA